MLVALEMVGLIIAEMEVPSHWFQNTEILKGFLPLNHTGLHVF